jgi:AhpD family alkylhydroperoxidase
MPRLRYIEESEKTPHTRDLIESAKRTGAPDPRVVSLMTRGKLGIAWVEYWNKLLYQGVFPHRLKEMCRIRISVAHQCGYCSTVRSNVARAEGLTEDMIGDLFDYAGSKHFSRARRRRCVTPNCSSRVSMPSTETRFTPSSPNTSAMRKSSNSAWLRRGRRRR